jgi:predicted Rossmann fold flavoprotein
VTVADVSVSVASAKLKARGPLLFTHWGLSGPAILRLSAWGARSLNALNYCFPVTLAWLPEKVDLAAHARAHGAKFIINSAPPPLPNRLWRSLAAIASIPRDKHWSAVSRAEQQRLTQVLSATELQVSGKSLNKDEFVTCGGVALDQVNFKTMESKICPGLYFAGELLDIDGITGGFNFQAAWTTGWIAGNSIGETLK